MSHTAGGCVLDHPAVVSRRWDHAIDVREAGWRVLTDHIDGTVVADDPLRVAVSLSVGDDTVRLTLDADGDVVCRVTSGVACRVTSESPTVER